MQRMHKICREHQMKYLVVSFPFMIRPSINPFAEIERALEELCIELDIRFRNLSQVFDPEEDLTRYWSNPFDSHPNGEANRRVSDFLSSVLAELR